ncbi:MAG: hypothetical protein OHK0013_23860 [Sandaracinaceae bacterium]
MSHLALLDGSASATCASPVSASPVSASPVSGSGGAGSGGAADLHTPSDYVALAGDAAWLVEEAWRALVMRSVPTAGVVVLLSAHTAYLPRVGTSPTVLDRRGVSLDARAPAPAARVERATTSGHVLQMSSAEQAHEVMAALSLNKTQLAEVLGVSRPTLYDWLEGKEPNVANARRLTGLLRLLASAGVSAAEPISPRFVREALQEGEPSLLALLKADVPDEARIAAVLAEAKGLEDEALRRRHRREERLRARGFEEPTPEARRANLALNVALREWPKE